MKPRGNAFTLIELLVAVAIIAILMSILIPALLSGMRRAQATQSASNLRQIGTALMTYANENNNTLPRGLHVALPSDPTINGREIHWDDLLVSRGYLNHEVLTCPAADYLEPHIFYQSAKGPYQLFWSQRHYAYNVHVARPDGHYSGWDNTNKVARPGLRLSSLHRPTDTIIAATAETSEYACYAAR